MSKTWKTKDGRKLLLRDMDDNHLRNAIAMLEMYIRALESEDLSDREIHSRFVAYLLEEDLSEKTNMRDAMQRELLSRKKEVPTT